MKLHEENGEKWIEIENEGEMACICFIETAMCDQLQAINPKAIWAQNAVLDVLDEDGNGCIQVCIEK